MARSYRRELRALGLKTDEEALDEHRILVPGAAARWFNRSASWLKFLERQWFF